MRWPKPRKKLIPASVLLVGIAVLIVAGITLQRPLRERYWIWKLETGRTEEERLQAADHLAMLDSISGIRALIDALDPSEGFWWVDPGTSELRWIFAKSSKRASEIYAHAVQGISERDPGRAEKVLKPYLSDRREIARAVAASVLFAGTDGAQKYVSRARLSPFRHQVDAGPVQPARDLRSPAVERGFEKKLP